LKENGFISNALTSYATGLSNTATSAKYATKSGKQQKTILGSM